MLSGEKILINGASGLVGMELAQGLTGHNEVWGLSRYKRPEERAGAINAWSLGREEVEAAGIVPVAADLMGDLSHVPTNSPTSSISRIRGWARAMSRRPSRSTPSGWAASCITAAL